MQWSQTVISCSGTWQMLQPNKHELTATSVWLYTKSNCTCNSAVRSCEVSHHTNRHNPCSRCNHTGKFAVLEALRAVGSSVLWLLTTAGVFKDSGFGPAGFVHSLPEWTHITCRQPRSLGLERKECTVAALSFEP